MSTRIKNDATSELEFSANAILGRILNLNEESFNKKPSSNVWSAGQITEHLLKSLRQVSGIVNTQGGKANRQPDKYEAQLKELMLDLSVKRKSAADIYPGDHENFKKITSEFEETLHQLVEKTKNLDLTVIPDNITFPSVGDLTRMEWLYFAAYHIQRHWHQLRNLQQSFHQQVAEGKSLQN